MKKSKKKINAAFVILLCANIFGMTGCGEKESESQQTGVEVQSVISEEQPSTDTDKTQEQSGEINTNRKTAAEYEAEDLAERAALEERVKAADGISEERAIEIAKKAMEADLGEKGKGLKLHVAEEAYGWRAYLFDLTDWSEYKDKGEIGYSIQFDNVEEIEEFDDLFAYHCMVNAVDGSICGAYSSKGLDGNNVWYEH